jgi:hypothetical protein
VAENIPGDEMPMFRDINPFRETQATPRALAERIDVYSLNAVGLRLYKSHVGQATIASREIVRDLVRDAASAVEGHKFRVGTPHAAASK